jgi:hypothetical protein
VFRYEMHIFFISEGDWLGILITHHISSPA